MQRISFSLYSHCKDLNISENLLFSLLISTLKSIKIFKMVLIKNSRLHNTYDFRAFLSARFVRTLPFCVSGDTVVIFNCTQRVNILLRSETARLHDRYSLFHFIVETQKIVKLKKYVVTKNISLQCSNISSVTKVR